MRIRFAALVFVSASAVGFLYAQAPKTIKRVPLTQTSATSGQEMFKTYCAVCHGSDGRGGGPAATALKTSPTNLTQLAAKNNGSFPENRVATVIGAETPVAAHGSQEMPVWGDLFKSLSAGDKDLVRLRIANLTYYIKSLQAK
jgi:mono/diheme cytochrome c family protein